MTQDNANGLRPHAMGSNESATESPKPIGRTLIAVLKVAAVYNVLAGIAMMVCYHEGFKALGLEKTEFNLPIQLVGLLVAIFGIGYWIVAKNPVENRNVLLLGFLSKLLGPLLAVVYIAKGILPLEMLGMLFLADTVYLLPFWTVYRRACAIANRDANASPQSSQLAEETSLPLRKTG